MKKCTLDDQNLAKLGEEIIDTSDEERSTDVESLMLRISTLDVENRQLKKENYLHKEENAYLVTQINLLSVKQSWLV